MADDEDGYERVLVEANPRIAGDYAGPNTTVDASFEGWGAGDELRPARGVVKGLLLGAVFWVLVAGLLWLL